MTQAPAGWYPHPETGAWWWWDGAQWFAEAPEGAPPRPPFQGPVPATSGSAHPLRFSVDYPHRPLSRVRTAFRLLLVIPVMVLLGLLEGATFHSTSDGGTSTASISAAGLLVLPPLLMIVLRRKYPRWWFDWNLELLRFSNRVGVYLMLMDDRYPSTDEAQSVHLDIAYPDAAADLNRWLPLVKWFLAIPHYFVLIFLYIGAFFAVVVAWFAILFTGRYPQGLFTYLEGVMRWHNRVTVYAFIMATDVYPPFSLSA